MSASVTVPERLMVTRRATYSRLGSADQARDKYYLEDETFMSTIPSEDLPSYIEVVTPENVADMRVEVPINSGTPLSEMMGPFQRIREAFKLLDHDDDEQWTRDGIARTKAVNAVIKGSPVSAAEVKEADPAFCREY